MRMLCEEYLHTLPAYSSGHEHQVDSVMRMRGCRVRASMVVDHLVPHFDRGCGAGEAATGRRGVHRLQPNCCGTCRHYKTWQETSIGVSTNMQRKEYENIERR